MRRRRFNPFGYAQPHVRAAVKETHVNVPCPYKRQRCSGCNGFIVMGELCSRFALAKRFRKKCSTCGSEPKGSRWFHDRCRPVDINKAMGYDPNPTPTGASSTPFGNPTFSGAGPSVAPPPPPPPPSPPPPKTLEEKELEALVYLEAALVARARKQGVTPEMEKAFKTFQGIKSRVLRPGTPAEGETALNIALKRIVDLVFTGR